MGEEDNIFIIVILLGLVLYVFLIYIILRRLTKGFKKEFDLIRIEEDEKENMFFIGLAHDIKTPLSTIMAYSKALEDGVVEEGEEKDYYKSIYNNGVILKERVDDMLELIALGDDGIFFPKEGDIFEGVRQFVGENYSWFIENQASINIEFDYKEKFITNYDHKSFNRLLENLLQNSVHHNESAVNICIKWNNKEKILIISDDGVGIPDKIKNHLKD